ncbi:MAG: helix-turn-helix transcriptional regulator [Rhizobacter sp.]|nr:helix-turn-helix transcriptional regulator [Ferruginibacter sp.]
MNYFKYNLKYLHKIFGLTQEDIASRVNKQKGTISNWESGLSEPNIKELIILSKYFDIRLDILVLVNLEKAKMITDEHVVEFSKKGKLKKNLVEYDTGNLPEQLVNEWEEPTLEQVLNQIKILNTNVGKLTAEIKNKRK